MSRPAKLCALLLVAGLVLVAGPARAEEAAPLDSPDPPSTPAHAEGAALQVYAFFATWCIPCRAELPHVDAVYHKYKDQGLAVTVVSVDSPSTAAEVPPFLARLGVTTPFIRDAESELLARYHPPASVPFMVLIDRGGRVLYAHAGYEPGDEAALEAAVIAGLAAHEAAQGEPEGPPATLDVTFQGLGVWRNSRFELPFIDGTLLGGFGRLEARGRSGRYTVMARVDSAVVQDESRDGNDDEDLRLERLQVDADYDWVRVRAGDSYVQLGQGVAMSLRKVDSLGVDTSLRGGRIDVNRGPFHMTAVGGRINRQNLDPIELVPLGDDADNAAGAQITVDIGDYGEIGPYAAWYELENAGAGGARDAEWSIVGGAGRFAAGPLRLVADGAFGKRKGLALGGDANTSEDAWASYAQAAVNFGSTTLVLESKYYRRWNIGRPLEEQLLYHEPPTLERDDQRVPWNADVLGGRARLEWRASKAFTLAGNALWYGYSDRQRDPLDDKQAFHGYLVGQWQLERRNMSLQAGYRDERREENALKLKFWHVDFDIQGPITQDFALAVKLNAVLEERALFAGVQELGRGLLVVETAWSGRGSIAYLFGSNTEDVQAPAVYHGGELRIVLPRGGEARLFGGRLAGGRVCVSGSCRDLPPFEGLRLDLIARY